MKKDPRPPKTFWGKGLCPQAIRRGRRPRRPAGGMTNAKAANFPRCCPIRYHAEMRLPDRVTGRRVILRAGVNRMEPICYRKLAPGRPVRREQAPALRWCARPFLVGTGVPDCPHRSYSTCHPEPPCGVKDLFADRRNRKLQWYRSSAFRGKILQSLRSFRMTVSGDWCGRTKALPYRDGCGHIS